MEKLDADVVAVALLPYEKRYSVPAYQRDYSWQPLQVNALLEDLEYFFESVTDFSNEYYLGQIITCPSSDEPNGESTVLEIVDGQQRITTVCILAKSLYEKLKPYGSNNSLDRIRHGLLQFGETEGLSTLELWGDGNLTFQEFMNDNTPETREDESSKNLRGAIKIIDDYLSENYNTVEKLQGFAGVFLNKVKIVLLKTTSRENGVAMFDRVNRRGLKLSNSDITKDLIFSHLNKDNYKIVSDRWGKASKLLRNVKYKKLKSIMFCVKAIALSETGKKMTEANVLEYWYDKLPDEATSLEFSERLEGTAEVLSLIAEDKTPKKHEMPPEPLSSVFNVVQHFPVLIAGGKLEDKTFIQLSKIINDRVLVGLIAGESKPTLESEVPQWAKKIAELDKESSSDDLKKEMASLEGGLYSTELLKDCRDNFMKLSYLVPRDKKIIRYLLSRSSCYVQININAVSNEWKKVYERKGKAKAALDLDHVMPQGQNYSAKELSDEVLHNIGNLVLVHIEQRGQKKIESKKKLYKDSEFLLAQALQSDPPGSVAKKDWFNKLRAIAPVDIDEWAIDCVRKRSELYWHLFLEDISEAYPPIKELSI